MAQAASWQNYYKSTVLQRYHCLQPELPSASKLSFVESMFVSFLFKKGSPWRKGTSSVCAQWWQFPWNSAARQRHCSQRQGQPSSVLRTPILAFQSIPGFAEISEGVIGLYVSSNPSSLHVHLLGSQEQFAVFSRLQKLAQPIPEGLPHWHG